MTQYKNVKSYFGGLVRRIMIPALDGSDYLLRWQFPIGFGRAVYLHKFIQSDDKGRPLHDHPWNFLLFIVRGRYTEVTPRGRQLKPRWSFNPATSAHRVELFTRDGKELPTYSILIRGRSKREWGFHTEKGWQSWKDFNKEHMGEEIV